LLIEFIEKVLPSDEQRAVQEHIEQCPSCRKQLLRYKNTISIMQTDTVPRLSPAKQQALFPLVMECVRERTLRIRRRNRFVYSFASAFMVLSIFIISIIALQDRHETDYYTLFFNPEHIIYSDDAELNEYVLESLIGDRTVISEVDDAADDAWINSSQLTSLVDDLSEDEVNVLIEKLENLKLNGG
jgi:hypothetical protein